MRKKPLRLHASRIGNLRSLGLRTRHSVEDKQSRFNDTTALFLGSIVIMIAVFLLLNNIFVSTSADGAYNPAVYMGYRKAYFLLAACGVILVVAEHVRVANVRKVRLVLRRLVYAVLFGSTAILSGLDFNLYRDFSAFIIVQLMIGWILSTRLWVYPLFSLFHLGLTLAAMAYMNKDMFFKERAWIMAALYAAIAIVLAIAGEGNRRKAWITESQLEEANEALRAASFLDPLTGLYNRRYLSEMLISACALSRRGGGSLSVVMLDVDHFKSINDSFGHGVGDDVLKYIAGIIHGCLRESDIAARYGGEEFLLLLPGTDSDGAEKVSMRLLERLRTTCPPGIAAPVTASAGVATMQRDEPDAALVERADQAMYAAKRNGRDQVRVSPVS